jgi:hypothetical protein
VPRNASPRWVLPRAPRAVARSALRVYQPINLRARVGWEVARVMASLGVFRLLRRGPGPPDTVSAALAPYLGARSTLSVARANHPGRFVALVIGPRGECQAIGKVATDERGKEGLEAEARALAEFGGLLQAPLWAPPVIAHEDGLLLFEMTPWRPRARPWMLPEDIAYAIGRFYRAGGDLDEDGGLAHGDFAPWNLLQTDGGWVVLDWEDARRGAPPFFDVWHFLVQGHSLLGRPKLDDLLAGLDDRGWVGAVLRAYADGARVSHADAHERLFTYLDQSRDRVDLTKPDGAVGFRARRALLTRLGGI